jgi:hypothetical protein
MASADDEAVGLNYSYLPKTDINITLSGLMHVPVVALLVKN